MTRSIFIGACALASTLAVGAASAQTQPSNQAPAGFCGGFGGSGTPVIKPVIFPQLKFDRSDPGFDCQMWQAFIYLNWPAQPGQRGVPNPGATFGAPGTTVWETYKTVEQVFLANGKNPGPWAQAAPLAAVPNSSAAQVASGSLRALTRESKISRQVLATVAAADVDPAILQQITQVGGGVLFDQTDNPVYYEIGMDEDQYNYVVTNGLYNASNQLPFAQKTTIALPGGITTYGNIGALEFKAAWKILTPAERSSGRFHTAQAIITGTPAIIQRVTVGLVGLHLFQMLGASTQGVWATFAQIDNAPVNLKAAGDNAAPASRFSFNNPACATCPVNDKQTRPTQVGQEFPDAATSVNLNMWKMIKQYNPTAPWQYYKLVSVQWPQTPVALSSLPVPVMAKLPEGNPSTDTLMNAVLETFLQRPKVSCLGCHQGATIASSTTPAAKNAASYSFTFSYAQPAP